MSKRRSLKMLFFIAALAGFTGSVRAEATSVPQAADPDAWDSSRQNREKEQNWYEMGEVPDPDACAYARGNRESCARWYSIQQETPCVTIKIEQVVHFEFNKSIIRPESYGILDDVSKVIRDKLKTQRVRVEGHTDSVGSDSYNERLSQRRAEAVKTYLVGKGIDGARLEAVGYGESRPIATNATAEGRSKNRRTEFNVLDACGTK